MAKINVLPKSVAELIAAGEVVERPASAVKELIENSIDAGATAITVEIKNGGVKYIRVTDNGCGIHREDVRTAFISHATSKIMSGEDLDSIFTLGFRGEALPSIAAVSKLSMLTKTNDEDNGTGIEIEGGEEVFFDDAGCPDGTTVIIKDLFYNTPARMKFLKKDMTEGTYVSDIVAKTALSHPDIRFTMIKDGKQTLSTSGSGKLLDTVYQVFGKEISESLIPCEYTYKSVTVKGYISRPLNNRPNRNLQYYYVNGRFVRIPAAAAALDEAYKNRIMVGKFPACFLFLSIPADKIDVNVHPAKTEVRFSDDSSIFETVFYAARAALNKGDDKRPDITLKTKSGILQKAPVQSVQMRFTEENLPREEKPEEKTVLSINVPQNRIYGDKKCSASDKPDEASENIQILSAVKKSVEEAVQEHNSVKEHEEEKVQKIPTVPITAVFRDTSGIFNTKNINKSEDITPKSTVLTSAFSASREQEREEKIIPTPEKNISDGEKYIASELADGNKEDSVIEEKAEASVSFTVLGEVFGTYILTECENKLLIIDKHAAHERIIFNELTKRGMGSSTQLLLSPVSVHLSGREYAAVLENLDVFNEGGFVTEDFGSGTVIVSGCPVLLQNEDIASIITEMAGELLKGNMKPVPEKLSWLYHSASCRAAVKAGDEMKKEETAALVKRILTDDSIKYCPHGRPVMYELTKHEIERQFGRV